MKRLTLLLIVAGFGLAAGSAGYLIYERYNVLTFETWKYAFLLLSSDPMTFIGEFENPTMGPFFKASAITFLGLSIVVLGVALSSVSWIIDAVKTMSRRVSSRRALRSSRAENKHIDKAEIPDSTEGKKKSFKWPFAKKTSEFDEVLDEQDKTQSSAATGGLLQKIIGMLPKTKSGSKTPDQEIVMWSGDERSVIGVMKDHGAFVDELSEWYSRVREDKTEENVLIAEAVELSGRATDRALERVRDRDPMNGEFMIRFMRAWAKKTPSAEPVEVTSEPRRDAEVAVMATAIKDVVERGISSDDDGEDVMDLEDEDADFMPASFFSNMDNKEPETDQEEGNEFDAPFLPAIEDEDVDLGDEGLSDVALAEGDEVSDAAIEDDVEMLDGEAGGSDSETEVDEQDNDITDAALRRAFEFRVVVEDVRNGVGEWPEEYAEEVVRSQHVQSLFAGLREMFETNGLAMIAQACEENEGDPAWDWIESIRKDLDAEKQSWMDVVVGETSGSFNSDDDDFEDDDISSDFDKDNGQDGDGDDQALAGVREPEEQLSDAETVPDFEESSIQSGEGTSGPSAPDLDALDFMFDEHDEKPQMKVEVSTQSPEVTEPQDVSLNELMEVETAGETLLQWAYQAKEAGASEAKIAHAILTKKGATRAIAGVIQMIAIWKIDDDRAPRRMNLFFRYVPEGKWKLSIGDDVRMTNEETGDFVCVPEKILKSDEVKSSLTAIHFHGPGVEAGELNKAAGNIMVVSEIMTAPEVRKAVGI